MTRFQKSELWQELEATAESFVRRKLGSGGYTPHQAMVVREWLLTQDAARSAVSISKEASASAQRILWARVVGVCTVLLVVAAFGEWLR